jgi:hypothetical protein
MAGHERGGESGDAAVGAAMLRIAVQLAAASVLDFVGLSIKKGSLILV